MGMWFHAAIKVFQMYDDAPVQNEENITVTSQKRHCVSNNRSLECLFKSLFSLTPKKTLKLH